MSFSIFQQSVAGVPVTVLQNSDNGERVEILTTFGGTVHRLALDAGKGVEQLLYCDADDQIALNPKTRSRQLFPWNDRLPNARFLFEGRTVQMRSDKQDGSRIHGLIRTAPMQELSRSVSSNEARIRLGIDLEPIPAFEGWPYPLRLEIDYILLAGRFRMEYRVVNSGPTRAPFALGWHPYFWLGGGIDGAKLTLTGDCFVEVGDDLMPTGATPSVGGTNLDFRAGRELGADELDVAVAAGDGVARFARNGAAFELRQDPRFFRWFQLYIPEDRQSIAIEPVSGATDALNRPELGLTVLEPGEQLQSWCEVVAG